MSPNFRLPSSLLCRTAGGWSTLPAALRRVDTKESERKPIFSVLTVEGAAVPGGNTHGKITEALVLTHSL